MRIDADGDPRTLLKEFGYTRCYYQNKPGIEAEHGTFWFDGKKYLIEFVRTVVDGQSLKWVVSTVSVFMHANDKHPEMVYHKTEEKMGSDSSRKRNAFLVIYNSSPLLAICDTVLGLVKIYEMYDLIYGVTLKFGPECLRFYPKVYENLLQTKTVVSFFLGKKCTLLPHEANKDKYEFISNFFYENNLKERWG